MIRSYSCYLVLFLILQNLVRLYSCYIVLFRIQHSLVRSKFCIIVLFLIQQFVKFIFMLSRAVFIQHSLVRSYSGSSSTFPSDHAQFGNIILLLPRPVSHPAQLAIKVMLYSPLSHPAQFGKIIVRNFDDFSVVSNRQRFYQLLSGEVKRVYETLLVSQSR